MSSRTALVTGPTSGIGLAFAHQLAEKGYDLVLVARNQERLVNLAAQLETMYGVGAEVMVADLSDRSDLRPVEVRVADKERPIDLLVNNAGYGMKAKFLDNSIETEQLMLDVLVTAVLRLTHAALGSMVQRGDGAIINVSSVAGWLPRGTYSAAKAYVTSFSEWANLTYRGDGVRVMALCPGFTKTDFHARMDVSRGSAPFFLWLDVDRLVRDALHDLEKGKSISVPSKRYKALSTLARYTPSSVQAKFQGIGRGD
jgi:hypothetical protein